MNDDITPQQAEPELPKKKGGLSSILGGGISGMKGKITSKISPYIGMIGMVGVIIIGFILGFAVAFSFIKWRDPAPNTSALAGGTHCASWGTAPAGYQDAIEAAAAQACDSSGKKCLQPALLGAIFLSEHGDEWPSWGPSEYKDRFLVAHPGYDNFKKYSPFQFEESTWTSNSGGAPIEGMMDFSIASKAAAKYIKSILDGAGIAVDTASEKDVECAGGGYNSGPDDCKQWASKGFPDTAAPAAHPDHYDGTTRIFTTNDYDLRTWKHFSDLNVGCASFASNYSSQGNNAVDIALFEATKTWAEYHVGGQKKHTIYLSSGQWCAAFVSYVYNKAGLFNTNHTVTTEILDYVKSNSSAYSFFYTPSTPSASKTGSFITISSVGEIMPGDIVWFNDVVAVDTWHHVGIVKTVYNDGDVATIEGDTGGPDIDALSVYDKAGSSAYVTINGSQMKINRLEFDPRKFSTIIGVARKK
jgi:hypothetical protein